MLESKKRRLIIIAGAIGLLVFLVAGLKTFTYVQYDAGFCTSCHIMDDAYVKWSDSVHSKVTCHECHANDIAANLRQLWMYWTNPPDKPVHRPELENSICYECHRTEGQSDEYPDTDPQWEHVMAEAGHKQHVDIVKIQCVRCHATSLHSFAPPSEICVECHKDESLEKTGMDEHCTACHAFKAINRKSLLPTRAECLGCHEEMQIGEEIFPDANGTGDEKPLMHWDCGKCHKPHTKMIPDSKQCRTECHAEKLTASDIHEVGEHGTCTACHKPHTWRITTAAPCLECHDERENDEEHTEGEVCVECHQ